ncbi:MAG: SH3 domain-containing protein, partial [Clostridiales bacterium]|nr:SH3 domain-containing protein [Clostridiales bacterium]
GSTAVTPSVGSAVVNNPRDTQVLFLRREASVNSEALGYYRNGKTVTLLARQGDWYKVSVDGKTGYMMAKYLKVTGEAHNGSARVFNANGGSYVNFRSRASLSASVIRTVPVGTTVKVLEKTTDWTKVEVDGKTGYISTWFLKF